MSDWQKALAVGLLIGAFGLFVLDGNGYFFVAANVWLAAGFIVAGRPQPEEGS